MRPTLMMPFRVLWKRRQLEQACRWTRPELERHQRDRLQALRRGHAVLSASRPPNPARRGASDCLSQHSGHGPRIRMADPAGRRSTRDIARRTVRSIGRDRLAAAIRHALESRGAAVGAVTVGAVDALARGATGKAPLILATPS